MYLKRIEMQGFKSFADKTVLEFKPGITTVIGPNGSGKSNISDAIRWVLGEQSMKSLRGAKSEDIIFAGTQARKSLGFAEVSIVIDNNDIMIDGKKVCGTTVYPTSEVFGFLAQFSFDDKSELISKICYPSESDSNKIAGYIDKLTREELRKEVLEWLL